MMLNECRFGRTRSCCAQGLCRAGAPAWWRLVLFSSPWRPASSTRLSPRWASRAHCTRCSASTTDLGTARRATCASDASSEKKSGYVALPPLVSFIFSKASLLVINSRKLVAVSRLVAAGEQEENSFFSNAGHGALCQSSLHSRGLGVPTSLYYMFLFYATLAGRLEEDVLLFMVTPSCVLGRENGGEGEE